MKKQTETFIKIIFTQDHANINQIKDEFLNEIHLIEMNFLGRKYNVPNVDFFVSAYGKD